MRMFNKSLLIDEDNIYFDESIIINKIKSDKKLVSPYGVRLNACDMGEDIIDKLINDKDLYNYISEYFNSDCCPMNISIVRGDKVYNYYLYKKNLLETIDEYIKNDKLNIDSNRLNNIKELTNCISINKLKEELNNRSFTLKINNKYVNCSYNLIFNFLEGNDKEFYNFFNNDDNYNGLSKSMFLYMVKEFYNQYNEGYLFDNNIKERIKYIENQDDIEYVLFDKKFTSEPIDSVYRNMVIDSEFKNYLIKDIPLNLSNLEKVIYIYIKLCKELNYDLEYYAVRQKGPIAEVHKNISNVKNVNLKNKNVVCYEFNAIFANLLNELNIDFEVRQHGGSFGEAHAWLRVNINDLLISFDSMHRILWEFDILNVKINNPLQGIKLYNKNKNVNDKFNDIVNKIYNLFKEQNKIEDKIDINKLSDKQISTFDKLNLLVDDINKRNLSEIESMGYLLQSNKEFNKFNKDEKIVNELILKKVNNEIEVGILFISYNTILKKEDREYNYYIYLPNQPFRRIDSETLLFYFENNMFEIYDQDRDVKVKGIDFVSKKQIDMNIGRIR